MDLSVIIVNYNVKYFLEQCLHAVQKASKNISAEIFVVDNSSVDGSCAMVKEKFSDIRLIENNENLGFSKANNQGIRLASGRYILLLNPDTVIEEDTLEKCIGYMDKNPSTGGLGVRMINGKGKFLPESKRAFPTPLVAFYKIFGLSRLFPRSRVFSTYHLGYLSENEIHEVDVLPGAYMMLRKSTLDEIGLLDEDFFMYGEDIDISYRLIKAGYKNIYYPETTIIHYKGESTRKGSLNYVLTFYKAMIIFSKKHFTRKMARTYSLLINIAIYFRAFLAILRRFTKNASIPIFESLLFYLGFYLIKPVWENYKFPSGGGYPGEFMMFVVPAYIVIWLISLYFAGAYDRPIKLFNVIRGIAVGTLVILVVYALLPESLRFSRALLLMGGTWALSTGILLRLLFHIFHIPGFELESSGKKRIIIVGSLPEAERVESVLKKTEVRTDIIGYVSPEPANKGSFLGQADQLPEIIKIHTIDEIIFCARDLTSQQIISQMMSLTDVNVNYKIAPPESLSIIGSNSINTAGDLYLIDINSINKSSNIRNKRLFDILSSLSIILLFPLLAFIIRKPLSAFKNTLRVFAGIKTWVGYYPLPNNKLLNLPAVKNNVLSPLDGLKKTQIPLEAIERLNTAYARSYKMLSDARILLLGIRNIGEDINK